MLTVADRGEGGGKICQNLADVICERSHTAGANVKFQFFFIKIVPHRFLGSADTKNQLYK